MSSDDVCFMCRALDLADRARGDTSPNPLVGAVVVSGGEIVGEGHHVAAGEPHAEAVALAAAGHLAEGATLYVTLEPCNHTGRTPPCTDAIIDAGIKRIVVAQADPDVNVAGSGLKRLRAANIEVVTGVEQDAAEAQIAAYRHQRTTGLPLVVVKTAVSVDGAVAAADGSARWISSEAARADAHDIRRGSDAIVVGSATVIADDPKLTVRTEPAPRRQPLRVVLDRSGRVRSDAAVFGEPGECLVWSRDIPALIQELARRGALQVMVEGGPTVAAAFLDAGCVDRLVVYVAAAIAGGNAVPHAFAGAAAQTIADFRRLELEGVERLGDDIRLDYVLAH